MALVIGHRGARGLAPENTLKSIRAAAFCKADYVEVDVRLSDDGVLVLMHDETMERTTGRSGKVEDLSLDEIRTMNVEGQEIPTLRQAIDLTKKLRLGIVVEMKEEGIEELVVDELEGQEALVTSFYHASLREIKSLSELRTGIIIASLPIRPVELAKWAEADFIFPRRTNPNLFKEAHRQGIAVCPWIVNEKEEAIWLLRLGADGLVTDNPCFIKKLTDQPARSTGKSNCEYYPCHHFQDQDCTHCFCPLYPCKDRKLGNFVKTKRGKRVWTCIDCQLVHKPKVAEHLTLNPEATIADLKIMEGIE
ncbi:MAG: glycerophosphodiester phosphodiesterase [Methanotrichaceae archaeon]|nr:glycerophosphodiester phosphodiesterase [Methanotrichaceae archaeon]